MRALVPALLGTLALAACANQPPAQTAAPPAAPVVSVLVTPREVKWAPAPPMVPPGAQLAVLSGDPGKPASFVARLKMPKGYVIPPHRHPDSEVVTVISGTLRVGQGEVMDRAKAQLVGAGSLMVLSAITPHYALIETETVLQISSTGPFDVIYVNPADDPRNKK